MPKKTKKKLKKGPSKREALYVCAEGWCDWEGLYLDGKLVSEGHSVEVDDVLRAMGVRVKHVTADKGWEEEHEGEGFPSKVEDLKFKKR